MKPRELLRRLAVTGDRRPATGAPKGGAFAGGALDPGTANWMLRLAQTLLVVAAPQGSASDVGLLTTVQYAPVPFIGSIAVLPSPDRRRKPVVLNPGHVADLVGAS